ncbi:hypothetical protein AgCh_007295 [Apium graveolens]
MVQCFAFRGSELDMAKNMEDYDDYVGFDVNGGNVISESVANIEKNVKSEMKSDVVVKTSDEIVDVKSGEIPSGECGEDGLVGGSEVSGFVGKLNIDSNGKKSCEKVSDGEKSDCESDSEGFSESEAEALSESGSEASSEYESGSSSVSI